MATYTENEQLLETWCKSKGSSEEEGRECIDQAMACQWKRKMASVSGL